MSIQAAELVADVVVAGVPTAVGQLATFDSSLSKVAGGQAAAAASSDQLGGSLGGMASQIKTAIEAFAAFEGVKFLAGAVASAEKTNQLIQTTLQLYGAAGHAVVDWSNTTATSLGLSQEATLGFVDSLGIMLKGFGVTGDAALGMSEKLVKVAVDVAAFKGADPSVVLAAFQKGLKGSSLGLGQYGIDVSAAAKKTEALSLGLDGSASHWTAANKAAIAYALILKGTAQETGTFAERSGSLIEQQKILNAEWSNMQGNIGNGLLPVATTLFSTLNEGFNAVGPAGQVLIGKFVGIGLAAAASGVGVLELGKAFTAISATLAGMGAGDAGLIATGASLTAEAAAATEDAAALTVLAEATMATAQATAGLDAMTITDVVAMKAEAAAATEAAAALEVDAAAAVAAGEASTGLLASIGPIGWVALAAGAAIGVLTGKTALFGQGQQDAGKATNDLIASMLAEGQTAGQVADTRVTDFIKTHASLVPVLKAAGISVTEVSAAVAGSGNAYDTIKTQIDTYLKGQADLIVSTDHVKNGMHTQQLEQNLLAQSLKPLTTFIDENSKSLKNGVTDWLNSTDATKQLAQALGDSAAAADVMRAADAALTRTMVDGLDTLRGQKEGVRGLIANSLTYQQQLFTVADAQAKWNADLKAGTGATEQGQKDANTLAQAQNNLAQGYLTNVDAAEKLAQSESGVLQAQKDLDAATKAYGGGTGKGTLQAVTDAQNKLYDAQQNEKKALVDNAKFMSGPAKQGALDLAAGINTIPPAKATTYSTPGLPAAVLAIHSYRGDLASIPETHTTTIIVNADAAIHSLKTLADQVLKIDPHFSMTILAAQGRAGGGYLDVSVPTFVGETGAELIRQDSGGRVQILSGPETHRTLAQATQSQSSQQAPPVVHNHNMSVGTIVAHDDRDIVRLLQLEQRKAEILAGLTG